MDSKAEEARVLTDDNHGEPPPYPGGYGYPMQGEGYGYPPQQPLAQYGHPGQPMINQPYPQQQVIIIRPSPVSNPPADHLVFNIIMTMCCCWPIGIFAIVKSLECRTAVQNGDRQRAENLSRAAKRLGMWTLGAGIATMVIFVVIILVTFMVVPRHYPDDYK